MKTKLKQFLKHDRMILYYNLLYGQAPPGCRCDYSNWKVNHDLPDELRRHWRALVAPPDVDRIALAAAGLPERQVEAAKQVNTMSCHYDIRTKAEPDPRSGTQLCFSYAKWKTGQSDPNRLVAQLFDSLRDHRLHRA